MDRLPFVKWLWLAGCCAGIGACDSAAEGESASTPSRVVAVAAKGKKSSLADLCDVQPKGAEAPKLPWPELADEAQPPATKPGFVWVNVWASWCKPCIEELPLIEGTLQQLEASGHAMDFVAISADESSEAAGGFQERFGILERSVRFADPATVPDWATQVGLDAGATLPLHVFVAPDGRVRCARAGAISEHDMGLIAKLFE